MQIFESFLDELVSEKIIDRYQWTEFATSEEFQSKKKELSLSKNNSRTHKVDPVAKTVHMLDVFSDKSVGVDLEYVQERKHMDQLQQKIGIDPNEMSIEKFFTEWTLREAAFKALWPDNKNVLLKDFSLEENNIFIGENCFLFRTLLKNSWMLSVTYKS